MGLFSIDGLMGWVYQLLRSKEPILKGVQANQGKVHQSSRYCGPSGCYAPENEDSLTWGQPRTGGGHNRELSRETCREKRP